MVGRHRPETTGELRSAVWLELVRMQLRRETAGHSGAQDLLALLQREDARLAEDVVELRQLRGRGEHLVHEETYVGSPTVAAPAVLGRQLVRPEEGRNDGLRHESREAAHGAQQLELVLQGE